MKSLCSKAFFLLLVFLLLANSLHIEAQKCRPIDRIKGKKAPATKRMILTAEWKLQERSRWRCRWPLECDNQYHSDDTAVVSLSTGWFNHKSRCHNNITISANGRSVVAMVVDECDTTKGCDADCDYQPPCPNNIVDASKAKWEALACSGMNGVDWTLLGRLIP